MEALFDVYSGRGSAAHPPDLLLKLVLYEHCRGRTKPIDWHRDLKDSINVRWLTFGMQVGQTTLYRFRDRVEPLIDQWHQQVLEVALAEGLVDGQQASIDGTSVAANASRRAVGNMQKIDQRLEQLEQAMSSLTTSLTTTPAAAGDRLPEPGWMAKTDTGKSGQQTRYQTAKDRLSAMHTENAKRRIDKRKPEKKIVISLTDPESVFGRDKLKVYRPLYNVQTVSDLATDFVLAVDVFAQHSDSGTLQPLMNRVLGYGVPIQDLLADAGYPVGEDLEFCERNDITLYAPWQENSSTARKKQPAPPQINKDEFQWDDLRGVYICPLGKELPFSQFKTRQRANGETIRLEVYQASGADCTSCPKQAECTTAPMKGRTVRRDRYQAEIDRLKSRMETPAAKLLYQHRGQTIERVFADFKEHRNMRRFRGRGLSRASTQLGLTVLGHNLRILAKLRQTKRSESESVVTPKNAA